MTKNRNTSPLNWHLPEIADKAEHQKLIQTYHKQEESLNKSRLLYPPDEVGPVSQLNYSKERRS